LNSEIINWLVSYTYSPTALPCAGFFDDDEDTQQNTDFDPDMLTGKG
jgi:hypothetical protein